VRLQTKQSGKTAGVTGDWQHSKVKGQGLRTANGCTTGLLVERDLRLMTWPHIHFATARIDDLALYPFCPS